MCGRFTLYHSTQQVVNRFGVEEVIFEISPRYNIAPSQQVAAIVNLNGHRVLTSFKWGLVPSWAKDPAVGNRMINARGETLAEKPSFKAALLRRRCIVPADGFYEWIGTSGKRQPVYVHRPAGELFALAGLWEEWSDPTTGIPLKTCTIITVPPNKFVARLHHRMAAILAPEDELRWLKNHDDINELLAMLKPYTGKLESYEVSSSVNSPLYDKPECISPLRALL